MLLLSIHQKYVDLILDGRKTVELRKRIPRASVNEEIAIYCCVPRMAIVATAKIADIQAIEPGSFWELHGKATGVTRLQFNEYYANSTKAVGLFLKNVVAFEIPLGLSELRKAWPGFHPPQQFRYLSASQTAYLRSTQLRLSA
ncbi:MAG: ASCH domain-containing protein [Pirellulaceae bacterium]|nr:ASCH domain-containing protein [Pirellulaceae bacterium]